MNAVLAVVSYQNDGEETEPLTTLASSVEPIVKIPAYARTARATTAYWVD